jgi:hypothetical protein
MTRLSAIAFVALLSAAAAAEGWVQLLDDYARCNRDASRQLASKKDNTKHLAYEATLLCKDQADALAAVLDEESMDKLRTRTEARNATIIELGRVQEAPPQCSACGMSPTWDPELRIWRPYRRNP